MSTAISIEQMVKTFGSTRALDGLDLTVEEGEVHGFLGPNGAGKTVTIRILLGLLRADRGSAVLLGGDVHGLAGGVHHTRQVALGGADRHPTREQVAVVEAADRVHAEGAGLGVDVADQEADLVHVRREHHLQRLLGGRPGGRARTPHADQ